MVAGMSGRAWILAAAVIGGAIEARCAADEAPLVLAGPWPGRSRPLLPAARMRAGLRIEQAVGIVAPGGDVGDEIQDLIAAELVEQTLGHE